jgi:hypothetical protein
MLLGLALADMSPLPEVVPAKIDDDYEDRPKKPTRHDEERIAAAQAKRERRAAKRRALLADAQDQGESNGT